VDEYFRFIDKVLTLTNTDGIDELYLDAALRPNVKELRGMWYDAGSRSSATKVAEKLAVFFEDNESRQTFYKRVADGKIAKPEIGTGAYSRQQRESARNATKNRDYKGLQENSDQDRIRIPKPLVGTTPKEPKQKSPWSYLLGVLVVIAAVFGGIKAWKGRSAS